MSRIFDDRNLIIAKIMAVVNRTIAHNVRCKLKKLKLISTTELSKKQIEDQIKQTG